MIEDFMSFELTQEVVVKPELRLGFCNVYLEPIELKTLIRAH